jgi:hypothetical protein
MHFKIKDAERIEKAVETTAGQYFHLVWTNSNSKFSSFAGGISDGELA